MTKQEWLIHILNGGKGTSNYTDDDEYIYFDGEKFMYSTGYDAGLLELHKSNFAVYEEPKKMIKVAPYIYKYDKDIRYVQTTAYYRDDIDFKKAFNNTDVKFQRLTALEIEVEDYEQN